MKYLLILSMMLAACGNTTAPSSIVVKNKNTAAGFEPVAVIELFTSQGCSSCPPADALLEQTINDTGNKNIFALSFHVDYWNRLGWTDPFSSAAYSQRQSDYVSIMHLDGAYTPQMVVNGTTEFVGSNGSKLKQALSKALSTNTSVHFSALQATYNTDHSVNVQYNTEGALKGQTIQFALVSLHETTAVKRGENGGATLQSSNVVRQMKSSTSSSGNIIFSAAPAKENTALIAFVQDEKTMMISGAAKAVWQ
ncbi:MAG: DUF1223 domain-containing protein [Bacteroidetes bacterium]|nr:DUF1223 domain-containing protein [Bacteroidota bacterium]